MIEEIHKVKSVETLRYPYYLVETRTNLQVFKVSSEQERELLFEGYDGEICLLGLTRYLEQFQGLKFISLEHLLYNYLSYDVDIRVGEIYGEDFSVLWKDIIASCMGKNDGLKINCFLKSFLYSLAINAANLCALICADQEEEQQIVCAFDLVDHQFSQFFFNSLMNYYKGLYEKKNIKTIFLQQREYYFNEE